MVVTELQLFCRFYSIKRKDKPMFKDCNMWDSWSFHISHTFIPTAPREAWDGTERGALKTSPGGEYGF